ncbi:MAG: arsenate reductase [Rhodobacteraceae bacterium]|nr:arsenate reductase [Paracoccaceae bacterium]
MKIYGLKTCDTCRKALKSLDGATLVDVRSDGLPASVMTRAISAFGDDIVNKRSTTWRHLSDTDRQQEADRLIAAHPTLMKRPLIEQGETLYLGWTPEVRRALGIS